MSAGEGILRVLAELKPVLPDIITAVAVTAAALAVLYALGRRSWVDSKMFPLVSLFFGMSGRNTLRLSCCWLKLVLALTWLIRFDRLALVQVLMLLAAAVIAPVLGGLSGLGSGLFWNGLQLVGLVCTNLVCGYILEMDPAIGFYGVYLAMALFMGLYSLYLFLLELGGISADRAVDPDEIWRMLDEDFE